MSARGKEQTGTGTPITPRETHQVEERLEVAIEERLDRQTAELQQRPKEITTSDENKDSIQQLAAVTSSNGPDLLTSLRHAKRKSSCNRRASIIHTSISLLTIEPHVVKRSNDNKRKRE
jgi:hypothetical protein